MAVKANGSLPSGTRVGRYEVVSLLATGGMGEVYVARDVNLGRNVALKILPPELTADAGRTARFVREAEASSALNHPAIVTVHDAGTAGGIQFLAMELIDGESLSEWLRKHRDLPRALELMVQVAEGLAVAHAGGIAHRDLKPQNIMVGRGGYAKVVDFGVAKLTERLSGAGRGNSDTAPATVIGTAAYMAPEQVEGGTVDHRADVFAFGTILYEIVTGRTLFAAGRDVDTMHNVVHLRPALEGVTPDLARILRRCLAKDPEQRYQSMKDLALDLREVAQMPAAATPRRRGLRWVVVPALLVAGLVAVFFAQDRIRALLAGPPESQMRMTRVTNAGKIVSAAISPDGKYVVHVVREGDRQALWVKQVATGTMTLVAPPEPRFYFSLRVSPDGNYIYYIATPRSEPNVADLYQLALLGGTPRKIASDVEFTFTISPDGNRFAFRRFNAFDREHRLTIADLDGVETVVLRRRYPEFVDDPAWSPDGKSIAFVGGSVALRENGIYALQLATREVERIPSPKWPGLNSIIWLPDGSGLLAAVNDREQPTQIWFLRRDGVAKKLTSDVNAYYSVTPTADSRSFVAVRDETDANVSTLELNGARRSEDALRPVTTGIGNVFGAWGVLWLNDREVLYSAMDKKAPTLIAASADSDAPRRLIHGMDVWQPAVSPDGRQIAFVSDKSGVSEIWVADVAGGNPRQVTKDGRATLPSFTPDGRSIVFSTFGEKQSVWRVPVEGGAGEQLTQGPTGRGVVSPDGRWLLCRQRSRDPKGPLWRTALVPLDGKGETRNFSVPAFGGPALLQWHPQGKAFSYLDWKDGIANVWLQDVDGGHPRQVTSFDGGEIFAFDWSRDGRRIVFSRGQPTSDAVLIRDFR